MPSPVPPASRRPARKRLLVVLGSLLVIAVAAPVVASVVQPEQTAGPDLREEDTASDPASQTLPVTGARPVRYSPAASPDRAIRLQGAEALAQRQGQRRAEREAKRARERREARQDRLRERAEEQSRKRDAMRERRTRQRAAARERRARSASFSFRIGSFNVLGSQHTAPGGSRQGFPRAAARTAAAANLVAKHDVDILGAQEIQADQLRDLQRRTGMAAWPGFGWGRTETDNSILYDPAVFEVVNGSSFTIPFMGRPRPQPIVRLRHLPTGRELSVVNTHPSAGGGPFVAQRRQGQAALVGIVNDLEAEGLPVLVTGDMNDRREFYCRVVARAGLVAPNGGSPSGAGGCRPPPMPLPVDWVVGLGMTWSDYWRDTTPVRQRTSDHFFISARARIGD